MKRSEDSVHSGQRVEEVESSEAFFGCLPASLMLSPDRWEPGGPRCPTGVPPPELGDLTAWGRSWSLLPRPYGDNDELGGR